MKPLGSCYLSISGEVLVMKNIREGDTDVSVCNLIGVYRTKDTHRENTPSNKTEVLTKSMNMYIWENNLLNELFITDSYSQVKFSKK